ncbi:MAG: outer membrane beta-barrel protein [Limisphaerales bacterium]
MNRIIATTGLAALGAVVLQPAVAQEKDTKPWNVTGTVRSFYDDNYLTLPKGGKRSSYGLELSPSGAYKFSRDQTTLDLSGRYGMRYYEDRKENSADHSFDFSANLEHRLTEKQTLTFLNSFAIAQEPGVLDPVASTFLRTQGNNLRNNAQLKYGWDDIIERWSGEVSYANTYYDYQQDNSSSGLPGSRSALLDRVEHLFTVAGRYRIFDETATELLLGYSFGVTDSTSKDALDAAGNLPTSRDSRSHYFFTGVGHKFTPELRVNARVGVQHVEYPNAALAVPAFQKSQTSPYVDASGTWDYLPNSSAQLGVRLTRITTDVTTSVDAAATTIYSSLNHEFTPDLKGSLLAQYQLSEYRQTVGVRDVSDNIFTTGVNLEWRFHQSVSLEGGYNYDRQDADLPGRSYYRNRLYIGFKASW